MEEINRNLMSHFLGLSRSLIYEFPIFLPGFIDVLVDGVRLDLEKNLGANFDACTFGERLLVLDRACEDTLDLNGLILFFNLFA